MKYILVLLFFIVGCGDTIVQTQTEDPLAGYWEGEILAVGIGTPGVRSDTLRVVLSGGEGSGALQGWLGQPPNQRVTPLVAPLVAQYFYTLDGDVTLHLIIGHVDDNRSHRTYIGTYAGDQMVVHSTINNEPYTLNRR